MKKIIGMTVMLFISIAAFSQNSRGYNNHSGSNQGVYNNNNGQPERQHNIDAGRAGELHDRTGDRTHADNQYHDQSVYTPQRRTRGYHHHHYTHRHY